MQRFGPVGPSSGIQCWTLCTKQTMQKSHSYCLIQKRRTRVNCSWRMLCYRTLWCWTLWRLRRDVTHPDSARVETAFWGWRSRSSLFLFSTVCCSCGSSQSPSLAGPPWCGPVGKSGLQLVFLFSLFLCWNGVHSSSCVGHSLSLWHTAGSTSCMIWDKPDFFVLHVMLFRMWYFLPVIRLSNVLLVTISWQHLHHLLLHLLLPVLIEGAGVVKAKWTRRFLRVGHLYVTRGELGMACFSF